MIMEELASIRRSRKIKQKDAAIELGTGQKRLSQVEKGRHSPSIKFVEQYANYLGLELKLVNKG